MAPLPPDSRQLKKPGQVHFRSQLGRSPEASWTRCSGHLAIIQTNVASLKFNLRLKQPCCVLGQLLPRGLRTRNSMRGSM
ncbi:hypothetical protein J2Y70_003248 [Xanthomonas translucens]|nr:hypothetical protein [Xanthomonas translucens]